MNKILFILWVLITCFAMNANAVLIDNGDGTITDTSTNLMWLQDANYARTTGYDSDGLMNWYDAMTWADNLVFQGYDDWRLPTTLVPDYSCSDDPLAAQGWCYGSEMGHLLTQFYITGEEYIPFINLLDSVSSHWSSTDSVLYPSFAFHYALGGGSAMGSGWQTDRPKQNGALALAVRDIAAVVPEPISSILFVTGGILLAGRWFFKRKK